jgi:hypothetical protein
MQHPVKKNSAQALDIAVGFSQRSKPTKKPGFSPTHPFG